MDLKDAERKAEQPETSSGDCGRKPRRLDGGASGVPAVRGNFPPKANDLMLAVVERKNLQQALLRVERNKGAPGIDKMPVESLRSYLIKHWPRIKEELLKGTYRPQPVRRVEIPKPGGGKRMLGIPTVLDRLIQQAIHQVLVPIFDPLFSPSSYGFRPGRGAHDAVLAAQRHIAEGKRWVVDLDLEKFFDRVNHDILMSRIARRTDDKALLRLLRRYLEAGVMSNGVVEASPEGTPQGGPLSPLLSNIMLDELDKELERRGHCFVRYADDCNVYVQSKTSGERVKASLTRFLEERLKLKVNEAKSAVDRPSNRKFLGYSVTQHKSPRLKVAKESVKRMKGKIRALFRRGRGQNLKRFINEGLGPLLRGWSQYFRLAEVLKAFTELDGWIRRKLRCILWRQWKLPKTRLRRLREMGADRELAVQGAWNGRGSWWNAGAEHMRVAVSNVFLARLGLVSLLDENKRCRLAG
jgi:RNA-directed DNA polymerase